MNIKEIHEDIMKHAKKAIQSLKDDPFDELRDHWNGFKAFMVSLFALLMIVLLLVFFPVGYIIAFAIRSFKK